MIRIKVRKIQMSTSQLTLAEIGFADLVADQSAGVEDSRHRIELHRFDHILLDDADLERERRHGPLLPFHRLLITNGQNEIN